MPPHLRVAVVQSLFNEAITEKLARGAEQTLLSAGLSAANIQRVSVPGAYEIPLTCQYLFQQGFAAVVAVGCVIRGETTHYTSVCEGVERGCMDVQLNHSRPIGFGVIMTENLQQAEARAGGVHGNKGAEAAEAMLCLLKIQLETNSHFLPKEYL